MNGRIEDINLTADGSLYTKTLPMELGGNPLIVGNSYCYNGENFRYIGDFTDARSVPNCTCMYTIGDAILIKRYIQNNTMPREKIKRKRVDDMRPINTDIVDDDNSLMSMMKSILNKREVTRGDFKQLYDNDSDMNNSLRTIEQGGNLSYPRFEDLNNRLGVGFKIVAYDKNSLEILEELDTGPGLDAGKKPVKVKKPAKK